MQIRYINAQGYLVPEISLPHLSKKQFGKYGSMRARFLAEHHPIEYDQMLLDGIFLRHLSEIDDTTHKQIDSLTKQLAKQAGVTAALKLHNPLEWTAQMQALYAQAEEIVCAELIFI